jgi:hypothetical protein
MKTYRQNPPPQPALNLSAHLRPATSVLRVLTELKEIVETLPGKGSNRINPLAALCTRTSGVSQTSVLVDWN